MLRFGISTHIFAYSELSAFHLRKIREAGFHEIELYANRPHFAFEREIKIIEISKALQNSGLRVNSVHAPFYINFSEALKGNFLSICSEDESFRKDAIDWIKRSLKIAEYINFNFLVIHFGGEEYEQKEIYLQQAAKSLNELLTFIKGENITIALENITNAISRPKRIAQFLKEYDFSTVGICFDIAHSFIKDNIEDSLAQVADDVLTFHIHDNFGQKDEHLVPFEGSIDWYSFLSKLQEIKFNGCLILESKGGEKPQENLLKCKAAQQKLEVLLKNNL